MDNFLDFKQFCCKEVAIPPLLPNILKLYTKGAIRTQPRDLLLWTGAYFRAMADGEVPPVKERLEYPAGNVPSGLTPGLLRVLHKQLYQKKKLTTSQIKVKWTGLCLPESEVDVIIKRGNLDSTGFIDWITFLTLAARSIARDITHAMELLCEILTDQPDGTPAYINFPLFSAIYVCLADIDIPKVPDEQIQHVLAYLKVAADGNFQLVGPPDFQPDKCPPLQ